MARKSAHKSDLAIASKRRVPSHRAIQRHQQSLLFWNNPLYIDAFKHAKSITQKRLLSVIETTIIPEFCIVFGILLFSFALGHRYLYTRSLTVSHEIAQQILSKETTQAPRPVHVYIQWFVDTQVESLAYMNGKWGISEKKATYLLQSARPGEQGNIIIYGHNTREILGNIRALKGGEMIELSTENDIVHRYKVKDFHEVSPSSISFLEPTQTEVLTLYTCSGPLDSLRFIVRAVPVQ